MTPKMVFQILPLLLFCAGIFVLMSRKNLISMVIGLELLLNAAALNFAYFSNYVQKNIDGQIFALVIMMVAVAEAVVALAIILRFEKIRKTIHIDEATQLQS